MKGIVIVDSGGANLASVAYAIERLGHEATISAEPGVLLAASHLILPGVGAAADAMGRLRSRGLDRVIPTLSQPVLGICLGMQLLYESSEEGNCRCLGIIPGQARKFRASPDHPVPHMGWNQLEDLASSSLLDGIASGDYAYFVHSYGVEPGPHAVATTTYGRAFSAVVSRGNFHGVQFHPERSSVTGARLLSNFLSLGTRTCN